VCGELTPAGAARAGTYVSNRTSDKITPLADNVFLCRSGSAADTQAVSDFGAPVARRLW
jgi:20S proteasome alpha/beta subunit